VRACPWAGGLEGLGDLGPGIAVDDAVCTVEQAPLLPMSTRACLPGLATHVAEFCTTSAGWRVARKNMASARFYNDINQV
jgi:hypothetical protein